MEISMVSLFYNFSLGSMEDEGLDVIESNEFDQQLHNYAEEDQQFNYQPEEENGLAELEQIEDDIKENLQEQSTENQKEMQDMDMQTEQVANHDRKCQTKSGVVQTTSFEMQTEEDKKELFSVNIQTDEIRKLFCSIKMQTIAVVTKSKCIDTSSLPNEANEIEKAKDKKFEALLVTPKAGDSSKKMIKKPALFLDNLSSPSDSGSNKNTFGNQNALNSKTSATSGDSGGDLKKNLNYLLNRDPMKEFFHLTLQSIRMNSPHMNQILNID
jgi:hypothetical protein